MAEPNPNEAENPIEPETISIDASVGDEPQAEEPANNGGNQVDELKRQLGQLNDRLLRTQAEMENVRKRARRELEDANRYALIPLLRDLLPVVDNMQRAIDASEKNPEAENLLTGFKMVVQMLRGILTQHNCVEIPALGEPFDPNKHEAIAQQPSPDHEPGTVMMVTQAGYQLHDRVIRPTQVIVASQPPEA